MRTSLAFLVTALLASVGLAGCAECGGTLYVEPRIGSGGDVVVLEPDEVRQELPVLHGLLERAHAEGRASAGPEHWDDVALYLQEKGGGHWDAVAYRGAEYDVGVVVC